MIKLNYKLSLSKFHILCIIKFLPILKPLLCMIAIISNKTHSYDKIVPRQNIVLAKDMLL